MIGKGMVANRQKAGHDLVVHDPSRAAAGPFPANDAVCLPPGPGLPATNRSAVDVHEARARVIADPAALEAQRRIADLVEITPLGPQIDGHSFDVIAVLRRAFVAQVHPHVGRRRTVSANHQKRIVGFEPVAQHPEHIEDPGIHRPDFVGMMIP